MGRYTVFMDQKTQYYYYVSSPQIHLQIQCNPNQNFSRHFYRNWQSNSKTYMWMQMIAKTTLKKNKVQDSGQDGTIDKHCAYLLTRPPKWQLNYRVTISETHLKFCWTEAVQPRTYRRSHLETGKRGRDTEQAGPTP